MTLSEQLRAYAHSTGRHELATMAEQAEKLEAKVVELEAQREEGWREREELRWELHRARTLLAESKVKS